MNNDSGRSPNGSGYSAEPEPSFTVSAVPVSIPNAAMPSYAEDVRRVILDAYKSGYFAGYGDGAEMFGSSASEERIKMLAAEDYGYLASEINSWERRIASAFVEIVSEELKARIAEEIRDALIAGCVEQPDFPERLAALILTASAIEARRAATPQSDAVHESAASEAGDAPTVPGVRP